MTPTKDAEFIAWALNIYEKCVTNATEWKLSTATLQELSKYATDARTAYTTNSNKEDRSRKTAKLKKDSFVALREYLSVFIPTLTSNMNISNGELEAMSIRTRKHHAHHPLPVPPRAPAINVDSGKHHIVSIFASIPQLDGATTYLKSEKYYGICLRTRLEGQEEWHEKNYTRLHVDLLFNDADVKKELSVAIAWINPRLEHGPWSDTVTVIIN
ncbi:MAG: hypothetical protein LBF09_03730 [Odoribacteraceae bacterium]|jgi:hypothetical protein|nr:hypothetical protein [Odoribacteraceae bacterium]